MKKLSTFLSLAIMATLLSGCYVIPYSEYHKKGAQCPTEPLKVELAPVKVDMLPLKVELEKKKPKDCPTCDPCYKPMRPICPY